MRAIENRRSRWCGRRWCWPKRGVESIERVEQTSWETGCDCRSCVKKCAQTCEVQASKVPSCHRKCRVEEFAEC